MSTEATTTTMRPTPAARHLLVTSPRTASNLLVRILNFEGQGARPIKSSGYFWLPSIPKRYAVQGKPMSEWTTEEKKDIDEVEQQCFDNLLDYINKAEIECQLVLFKEHALLLNHPFFESEFAHGKGTTIGEPTVLGSGTRSSLNKTVLSDEFLKTFKPTFLIRHPALSLASMYRAARSDVFGRTDKQPSIIERSSIWNRTLFDFYEADHNNSGERPLVLDADDMMTSPELMSKYARLAGLDPDKLVFSWERASQEELSSMSAMARMMLSSLSASDSVNLDKVAGNLDIAKEAAKWRAEFGDEDGSKLESWVRAAMSDYEYIRSKRLNI
ncbi:hypothetical protein LCI18_013715 [Fusarium solani-melongenae]|uniref:Uncharacterized protein n=1 Tax=Fusarium solani subsp. cucurbitae TaxID=2747967 RepID=A0ACD3ZNH6_FUSSC|nr:hypothetical protein LCI18_013715 [Fusarium solani-melongenae]